MSSLLLILLTTVCVATNNSYAKQTSDDTMPASYCCACQPGTHGKPGSPGIPGRDGRDGREGNQGVPGPSGPPGLQGVKGDTGIQGPSGQKGEHGETGTSTISGTPGVMFYKNWKECVWKFGDGKDHGLIKDCMFTKNFSDTALHVYWTGTFRVSGCTDCCKRWYFTFNGVECSAPLPIDGIVYLSVKSQNVHRVRHIEGHCNNIHKGKVRVGFWVGNCPGYGNADAHTGYIAVSRIFVEEVPKPQA